MGHQSPNPPQPAQLLGSDHIQTRQRGSSVQLTANLRWHLWVRDLPEFTHRLKSCGLADRPRCPEQQKQQRGGERLSDPERPAWSGGVWGSRDDASPRGPRSRLKNIWNASLQSAGGVTVAEEGLVNNRHESSREIDQNTTKSHGFFLGLVQEYMLSYMWIQSFSGERVGS